MLNGIITGYQVQYRLTSTHQNFVSQNTTSLTYTVTGLSPFTGYDFRVAAATREGLGPVTDVVVNFTTGKLPRNEL